MSAYAYYSALMSRFKRFAIVIFAGLWLVPQAHSADLHIESGPGQLLGVNWAHFQLEYRAGQPLPGWILSVAGLSLADEQDLGDLVLTCRQAIRPIGGGCIDGRIDWQWDESEPALSASFVHRRESGFHHLDLREEYWRIELQIPENALDSVNARIVLDQVDLSVLPAPLTEALDLDVLYGVLSGEVRLDADQLSARLSLAGAGFDGLEGLVAADGLELELNGQAHLTPMPESFSLSLIQSAGELLFGSLYLPSPEDPLRVEIEARWSEQALDLDRVVLMDSGALELAGTGRLVQGSEGWEAESFRIDSAEIYFPRGWRRWMDGHAAAAGFGDLDTIGRVRGSLDWHADQPLKLEAELFDVTVDDPRGRLALDGVAGQVGWERYGPAAGLSWGGLKLFGFDMKPSSLSLAADAEGVHLQTPLRLPLLDGAVVIDGLVWAPMDESRIGFGFDARIEPLDLAELTRALEWPEFGGQLSGEFPGVMLADEVLSVAGGIDVQAFSGHIQLSDLAIERPFGTLPALSAQVEFSRLDLLELTGAFNFGRMEGQLSGWMHDLRLLDWRPVAMDARIFTHEDVPRRRISQRAVENISDLGGGGGALLSGTVLRVFEDFPYRRAGLACRLSNNICHIDGVARHDSGGFYIVEGRALPRLDIVGHRRLVDWPQLMGQLAAMVE